ncbi:MAG: CBS domain-containing protein [Gammaproteobacteria bacterium]|jgi:predicted transcriptional regulator|nr:CBS domain-containing protein [Gammaproteobacteria bacterium]MBT4492267.1 CBS domain-containing protein [Gammaproteobacteria bacterium]MBT7370218.1 CBS domain-containing protein [Gammaproteobacteria bacterium]
MNKILRVKDIMRDRYLMIDGVATVAEAISAMRDGDARALVVNKRDENDEYGIVLLSDIAKKVLARDRHPDRVNVYEIMSKPVVSVHADMDVRYCSRMFDQFGLATAPVLLEGQIIGIVDYQALVLNGLAELY